MARIVGLYVVFSAVWILLSDRAVSVLVRSEHGRELAGMVKGWFFVAVTGATLYGLLVRLARQLAAGEARARAEAADRQRAVEEIERIAAVSPGVLYSAGLGTDGVFRVMYAAPAVEQLFGLPHDIVVNDPDQWRRRVHPDDAAHGERTVGRGIRDMAPWSSQFRYDHPLLGERWIEERSAPAREADGSYVWSGVLTDITERKQIEQALIEADDLLRDALTASRMAVWEWEDDARRLFVSPEYYVLTGMSEPVHELADMEHRMAPEAVAELRAALETVLAGGAMAPLEIEFRRDDGSTLWLEVLARRRDGGDEERPRLVGTVQDVTERRRAAEAMHVLEQRSVLALEAAGHGVWDYDGRTHRTFFSPQWKAMLGYADHEISDDPLEWDRRVHPDDLAATQQAVDDHIAGRTPMYRHEHRMLTRDGGYLWVLDQGEVLERDADGRPLRLLGTFTDVSWKHELDERLRENDERYRSIVSSLSEGLVLIDADGTVRTINRSARRMLGLGDHETVEQLPAHFDSDAVDRSGAPIGRGDHPLWRTLRTAEACRDVVVGIGGARGSRRWLAINAEPILGDHDRADERRAVAVVASLTDITERLRVDRELLEHRQHLEKLVADRTRQLELAYEVLTASAAEVADLYDNAPCGYHSIDSSGTFVAMNATELAWLGYERDEVIGKLNVSDVVAPESQDALARNFPVLLQGGALNGVELIFQRRDGTTFPVVTSASAITDGEGNFVASRSTVFDDTARQERDRQIAALNVELERRAHEAEAANRAKSVFLATMSHEIRTPLNAIVGLSHLVRDETSDVVREDLVAKLYGAAQHLTSVISDVLDLSRIEADKVRLEAVDLRLADVLADARGLVTDRAVVKGIAVEVELDPSVPDTVVGDPTRLRQLVLNYLTNAVKFTEHGRVVVRCRAEVVTDTAVTVRVEVADTGPGISPAEQARLFVPFEQLDATTTRRHGGSGLGLAINRRLADLMGGEVGVSSIEGEGSTFWFTATLGRSAPSPAPAASPVVVRSGEPLPLYGRVLLAEDDDLSREVAVTILRNMGLAVDAVADGVAAVRKAASVRYDLVLMDLHMPRMDGITAMRILRGLPGMVEVPIVAMTANAFAEDRDACLAAGATDHVAKPVEPAVLRATLACWLSDEQHHIDVVEDGALADSLAAPGALPGVSPERGLRYTSGDAHSYLRWLHRFAATNAPVVPTLSPGDADITGDRAALLATAHRLKGSAGLIGAIEVEELATRLNDQLRNGPADAPIVELARALGVALGRVVAAIDELPDLDDHDDDTAGDASVVERLASLLESSDVVATDLWARSRTALHRELGERATAVGAAIERYDYDGALALLRQRPVDEGTTAAR